jgi:hypothetical protein
MQRLPASREKSPEQTPVRSTSATLCPVGEVPVQPKAASRPGRPSIAAIILGILIGAFGAAWFGLLYATPWIGWESPLGSMIRSLHGIASAGFCTLPMLSIGLAFTRSLRTLFSAVCCFQLLAAVLCLVGLALVFTAVNALAWEMLAFLMIHGAFVVGCSVLRTLLK